MSAHRPTVTLQLCNFDLFRSCRTNSFCTLAWQLARFQLTRHIALSLGDRRASCLYYALCFNCTISYALLMRKNTGTIKWTIISSLVSPCPEVIRTRGSFSLPPISHRKPHLGSADFVRLTVATNRHTEKYTDDLWQHRSQ